VCVCCVVYFILRRMCRLELSYVYCGVVRYSAVHCGVVWCSVV
jgi:hypothetical protein